MTTINKIDFLTNEFPALLDTLNPETKANFGLMTPQHMVEHLVEAIRSATVQYEGERESPANAQQLGMQQFIKSGSVLSHRPSDKTVADLPSLKYTSIKEAISQVPKAVKDFYDFHEKNPDYIPYATYLGEVPFEDVELFHFMHIRYHLWQFGLLQQYP